MASSQLKIKHYEGFGGNFVDSDYLAAAYRTADPYMFESIFRQVYSSMNYFSDKPVLSMLLGNKITIDDEIYRWTLTGSEHKVLRSVEVLETSTTPGIGGTEFRIKLDEDWLLPGEVIMPEDNDYLLRIKDGPFPEGLGAVYVVYLAEDDPTRFLPASYLEVGKTFTKATTAVQSEMNSEFGGQQYPNSYMLESQVGFFGQSLKITDKALRQSGRIGIPFTVNGKKVEKFVPMAEMKMFDEFELSKEVALVYGKRMTKPGKGGYWIKTGPGMREQMKDGNVERYSGNLTESRLKNFLLDIFFARNDRRNRKVRVMTGTMGSVMFHEMLASSASGFLQPTENNFIKPAGTGVTANDLQFGGQFTRYIGPEGIEVEVYVNPQYDSFKFCPKADSVYTDRPIDSWRMTFLDFAAPTSTSFGSNINMLEVANSYSHGYVEGTVGPNGPIQGAATTKLLGCYERWVQGSAGVMITDVTRTGELIRENED